MRILKDLELVEHLGSGIPRILEHYPKSNFKFSDNFIRMTFSSELSLADLKNTYKLEIKSGGAIISLNDKQKSVYQLILNDNKISYRSISEQLDINQSSVLKHIEILKDKGFIERIGGTRGIWKVKKRTKP